MPVDDCVVKKILENRINDSIVPETSVNLLVSGTYWLIGLVGRVFANGLGDLGSIPGRVIPKTLKMVLDTSLLNTQHYKVRIKGKVEQSRGRSSALPYTSVKKLLKKEASGHPRLRLPTYLLVKEIMWHGTYIVYDLED